MLDELCKWAGTKAGRIMIKYSLWMRARPLKAIWCDLPTGGTLTMRYVIFKKETFTFGPKWLEKTGNRKRGFLICHEGPFCGRIWHEIPDGISMLYQSSN